MASVQFSLTQQYMIKQSTMACSCTVDCGCIYWFKIDWHLQHEIVQALRHLDSLSLHSKDLVQTQVGKAVKKLRTHDSGNVRVLATKVCVGRGVPANDHTQKQIC